MTKEERRAMRLERKQNAKEAKEKNRENCGTLKEQYANLWFIYKFIFRTSPKLVFIRIPLLMLQTVQAMVSIFFVREIINELTEGKSIRRVIGPRRGDGADRICAQHLLRLFGKTRLD